MYVPGIRYDRPVPSRRAHDTGGPGRVARAQASAAGAAANAAGRVLMAQQKIAGFTLQMKHGREKTELESDRIALQGKFDTLDAIGDIIGIGADLASRAYEIHRQNEYDKGVLRSAEKKALLFRNLNDNKYRMEPENPADPASPMAQRANYENLTLRYSEQENKMRAEILGGMTNETAKRDLQAKWDAERIEEIEKVHSTSKSWKEEQDILDTNTSIAEYTKRGQFEEAITTLKSAYSNGLIDPAQYAEGRDKLTSAQTAWEVDEIVFDINVSGPDAGAPKIAALEARLQNMNDLIELGPGKRNQIFGTLQSIKATWQSRAEAAQRKADRIKSKKYTGQHEGMISATAAAREDIQTAGDIDYSLSLSKSMQLQLSKPSNLLRPEDQAKLKTEIERGVAGAMVSHVGHLQNVTGNTEAAEAFIQMVIASPEEDLGLVRGSGSKATIIANMRTVVGHNKDLTNANYEAAWKNGLVKSVLDGARLDQADYEGRSPMGKEYTATAKEILEGADNYFLNMLEYQEATGDTSGDAALAADPLGRQATAYASAGQYPANFSRRLYNDLRSEKPDAIIKASQQVDAFGRVPGGEGLQSKLIKGMSDVEADFYSYYDTFKDKMEPDVLMASLGQYIADNKEVTNAQLAERTAQMKAYAGDTKKFNAALIENLQRDDLDPDDAEAFIDNNPEFVSHLRTLMNYNAARSSVPAVNFTNAYHQARMSFGLSTVKGFPQFERDNLESKTGKVPNEWVNQDYRNAALLGGVQEEVLAPNARQIVEPAGDGKWVVQVIGEDGQLVPDRNGDPWTYLYDESQIPGFVKDNKRKKAEANQTRYANGQEFLIMLKETYPGPTPTHAEAFSYIGQTGREAEYKERDKSRSIRRMAEKEVRKIAPSYAYLYPDTEVTRAIDPKDFDLKGSIRLMREQIDAMFDQYIQDRYYTTPDSYPPPTLYQAREDAKYAAEYNLKHRNYEDWKEDKYWRQERAAVQKQAQHSMWNE